LRHTSAHLHRRHGTTIVPCPDPTCQTRHIITGEIHEVQVERNGKWVSYDWKAIGNEDDGGDGGSMRAFIRPASATFSYVKALEPSQIVDKRCEREMAICLLAY
jgi:hypothetical protein